MPISKSRTLRVAIPLVVALLIVTGVYRYWLGTSGNEGELVLYGNVDMREVELAFVVQERLIGLHAEEGDSVKTGLVTMTVAAHLFRRRLQ